MLSIGCDPHVDSVYLGRAEANLLAHVSRGNIAEVKEFLDRGGNVNLQDEPSMTALHHAANADNDGSHIEMIQLLLDRGANVNAVA
jgi:ankyrin repeat protein